MRRNFGENMSEEAKNPATSDQEENATITAPIPPKKGKKMIIIIAGISLLLIISGALYYFMFYKKKPDAAEENISKIEEKENRDSSGHGESLPHGEKHDNGKKEEIKNLESTDLYKNLEDFLVDLKASGATSFIKVNVTLKVDKKESLQIIDNKLPIIRDSFITYLRELRTDDLYGSSGLFVLKQELLMRINKIIAPAIVEEIYIQNILTR